jgi:type I restriction enzyme S subunit
LRGINGLLTPYIRYIIGHHSFTDYVKGVWTGVAVPHISESQIRAFNFLLPPIEVQEGILRILTAYDDLIGNNTRRIKILEQMAHMLYREWFVNFRFPGHQKVKMVESEWGPIPEGWKIARTEELCSIEDGDWIETKDQGGNEFRLLQVSNIGVNCFIETGTFRFVTPDVCAASGMRPALN